MFFYVLIVFILLTIILFFSKIKVNIQNVKISTEKHNGRIINTDYKIIIALCIFNKINILKSEITKDKLDKWKIKEKLNKVNIKKPDLKKLNKEKIKRNLPEFKFINLNLNLGLEDAALTSFSVATISSSLGIILRKTIENSKQSKYIVNPIYSNSNSLSLELNCIIEEKIIHMIRLIM